MKKNEMLSMMAIIIIVVAGVFFYGGMKYAQSKSRSSFSASGFGRTGMGNRQGMGGMAGMSPRGANGGFTSGEIIAKDATSITIKLQDGGSKIVFLTSLTPVTKTVAGTSNDVAIGQTVNVTGKANPDGSVNADQIQLRPTPPQTPATN